MTGFAPCTQFVLCRRWCCVTSGVDFGSGYMPVMVATVSGLFVWP